jgi:hypothetical protein
MGSFVSGSTDEGAKLVLLISNILLHLLQKTAAPTARRIRHPITREINSMEVWLSGFTASGLHFSVFAVGIRGKLIEACKLFESTI